MYRKEVIQLNVSIQNLSLRIDSDYVLLTIQSWLKGFEICFVLYSDEQTNDFRPQSANLISLVTSKRKALLFHKLNLNERRK